jgi:membrane dipeptidase
MRAEQPLSEYFVWDNHACLPLRPQDESFLPQLWRYRAAGANVVTLNVAWDGMAPETALAMLATLRKWFSQRAEQYLLIETAADLDHACATGKLGVSFDIEGGNALREHLPMVQLYYDLGVRWMLPVYNRANSLGAGCLDETDHGLTDFGRAVVDEMCRVGMIPCCSHTGARTALEVMDRATLPVIFSHSNALGVWLHPRNISDELIRACARTGGTVGVNGYGRFLGSNGAQTTDLLDHVCYVADLVGPEHVALGLDFVFDLGELVSARLKTPDLLPYAGLTADDEPMVEPERLPQIAAGLAHRGWGDAAIAGFLGNNLRRVAQATWKPVSGRAGPGSSQKEIEPMP